MKERLHIRPTLLVPIRNASAFLEIYFPDPQNPEGGMGGILVPVSTPLAVGDRCELELAFAAEHMVFHCKGIARWRRVSAQRNLPAGIGVEFDAGERRTRNLLIDFAHGKDVQLVKRGARRFPVEIEVEYSGPSGAAIDVTDNLSATGCFLRTASLPGLGAVLDLKLKPVGFLLGIPLRAEVVWQQREHGKGVGLRFMDVSGSSRKKLDELLERVKRQALEESESAR